MLLKNCISNSDLSLCLHRGSERLDIHRFASNGHGLKKLLKNIKRLQKSCETVIHLLTLICYDALANTETGGVIDRKMTDKELRKLPRRDLLELLVQQTEDNEDLQSQLDVLNVQLQSRNLSISKAETLADAVVQINDLQKIADAVAKQFLDNVRNLVDRQEDICANMEQECQERCEAMVAEAERNLTGRAEIVPT